MKRKLYKLALAALLPVSAFAQPVVNTVEDYQLGTSVKYVNCNAQNVMAGGAGANQHWMFMSLTPIDTVTDNIITPLWTPYASQHPNANIVRRTKDGDYLYYNKTADATYLVAEHDVPANKHLSHPNTLLSAKRPLTYNNTAIDTFTNVESSTTAKGRGIMNLHVDGYGMLHLPNNQVYNNTIRIKVTMASNDTIAVAPPPYPSPSVLTTIATMYTWYDNDHKSALFRIDSISVYVNNNFITSSKSAAYFLEEFPYSVDDMPEEAVTYAANINGQTLTLNGSFSATRRYEADICNLNGQKLQHIAFSANGKTAALPLHSALPAGMYIVVLNDNTNAKPQVLKAVQQ
jgi:hypothetical protein